MSTEPERETAAAAGAPAAVVARQAPHRGHPRPLRDVQRWLRVLGPGLISGAADDDPSAVGTYTQAGAAFGAGQLWLAIYIIPLMIAVQEMCGRIGIVTKHGIAGVVRQHYPRGVLYGAVMLVTVANTIQVGADLGAMAAAGRLLVSWVPTWLLVVLIAVVVLGLEVFVPYRHYARVLKALALSLLAYVAVGLVVATNWRGVLRTTLVPQIRFDQSFLLLVVAILGSSISPYIYFWQASAEAEEEVASRRHHNPAHGHWLRRAFRLGFRRLDVDTSVGMVLAGVTNWFIIFAASQTLNAHGVTTVASADQAAAALRPLVNTFPHAGAFASGLFALGIIGTGLLAVPVLAGSAAYGVSEALGWREGLNRPLGQAPGFYGVIAVATVGGLLLNLVGINPMQGLIVAAVINGVVAAPLLVVILLVANNRKIMGEYVNGRLANALGILTTVAMGGAALTLIVYYVQAHMPGIAARLGHLPWHLLPALRP